MTWRVVRLPFIHHFLPAMNDNELHALIRQTHPKPEFPASFQRDVWACIAVVEQQTWAARWQQLLQWIARPAPALAMVLIMLAAGIALGGITASGHSENMRIAYAASINPIKMAHAAMQP